MVFIPLLLDIYVYKDVFLIVNLSLISVFIEAARGRQAIQLSFKNHLTFISKTIGEPGVAKEIENDIIIIIQITDN